MARILIKWDEKTKVLSDGGSSKAYPQLTRSDICFTVVEINRTNDAWSLFVDGKHIGEFANSKEARIALGQKYMSDTALHETGASYQPCVIKDGRLVGGVK